MHHSCDQITLAWKKKLFKAQLSHRGEDILHILFQKSLKRRKKKPLRASIKCLIFAKRNLIPLKVAILLVAAGITPIWSSHSEDRMHFRKGDFQRNPVESQTTYHNYHKHVIKCTIKSLVPVHILYV